MLAALAIVAAHVLAMQIMGRTWGEAKLWTSSANSASTSQRLLDPYSVTHVLHGLILYWATSGTTWSMHTRFVVAVVLETLWELVENTPMVINKYRSETVSVGYEGDSVFNSIGDILCCCLGFWIAKTVPWQASLALFVLSELGLLWLIRDNLTLNVVQLLRPSPTIKKWQMSVSAQHA